MNYNKKTVRDIDVEMCIRDRSVLSLHPGGGYSSLSKPCGCF